MENRKGTSAGIPEGPKPSVLFSDFLTPSIFSGAKALRISNRRTGVLTRFHFLFSIFCLIGCGAPGEPVPPSPPVPVAIADLTARQNGDGVEVSFTLPTKSITGTKLTTTPAVEILRGSVKADGTADTKSFRVVYTIPGAMVESYRNEGGVVFTDSITAEETKAHPGATVAYAVRTRVSQKKTSAASNVVYVRVFPVPAAIAAVEAKVTETAVELSWTAPTATAAGEPVAKIPEYRIYRSESRPANAGSASPSGPAQKEVPQGKVTAHMTLLASSETNSYHDTSIIFDDTYVYTVRSVVQVEGNDLESAESAPVTVTPKDIFPPTAPQGVVAAVLPGAIAGSVVVDLSWSINLETDLAGYHVYRSEQEGTRGRLLQPDLLPTPAVRDTSVEPGHRYWYIVTAVDRAGNESADSTPIVVEVTQPNP
jgi:fibronectin type 3 domain-containing protein